MTNEPRVTRSPFLGAFWGAAFATVALTLARAVLIALRFVVDGSDSGLTGMRLAIGAAGLPALGILSIAFGVGLVVRSGVCESLGPRIIVLLLAAATGWAYVTGWLPPLTLIRPDLDADRGLIVALVAVGVAVLASIATTERLPIPLLRVGALAGAAVLALGAVDRALASRPSVARPNLILISLDTVRADRLGCYGNDRSLTPTLDAFAEESIRFERAYTVSTWTLTAHMSMLTGLTPGVHTVKADRALPVTVPTLAALLRDAGYRTLGVADQCPWVGPRYGFGRGFDLYRRTGESAAHKIDEIFEVVDIARHEPLFLFAHFFDAHSDENVLPYEADEEAIADLAGWYDRTAFDQRAGPLASELLKGFVDGSAEIDQETRRWIADLYDAGLRTLDRDLEYLFLGLKRRGMLENSVIVVTADHGEELFEFGRCLHGGMSDRVHHVPLLIRLPGGESEVRGELASIIDILPTLLGRAGVASPETQGIDLLDASTSPRSFVQAGHASGPLWLRGTDWAVSENDRSWEIIDPWTAQSLGPLNPQQRALLEEVRADIEARRSAIPKATRSVRLRADERDDLRGLGYSTD